MLQTRKHITQLTAPERASLIDSLRAVHARGLYLGGHVRERVAEKNISESAIRTTWTQGKVIEISWKDDDHRVLIRHDGEAQAVCIVVSLVRAQVVTAYTNSLDDTHKTLNWNIYKPQAAAER